MKVKNDLDVIGNVVFEDYEGAKFFSAVSSGTGGIANDELTALYLGDIDSVISSALLTIDMLNDELVWGGDSFSLPLYSGTNKVDNTMDYVLGTDSNGNVKKIEKSTLGSSSNSEAFFAYLDTNGGSIGTTDTLVEIDTTSLNTNTDVFDLNGGELTVNADMNLSLSFNVGVANPSVTRISARALIQVSTDGGSNWNELLGSRCWAYVRQGFSNDDHTIGGTTVLVDNTSGDKYRVMSKTASGTVDIINYACSLSVHDLSGGEAGPTGPAGTSGATNTSLALDGSNILTLTDSESDTVTVDLSSLAGGGSTPTLGDVTTAGGNTSNNIGVGNLNAQGSLSSGGFQVNGGFGFIYADEEEEGFHVQDIDETDILTITGSIAGSDAQTVLDGSIRFLDYAGNITQSSQPTKLLAVDNSGDLTTTNLPTSPQTITDFLIEPTSKTGTTAASAGSIYIIDLANTSGGPTYTLPGTSNTQGDQIWIASNSTTSVHSNRFNVSGKIFDIGSSAFSLGGRNDTTANQQIAGRATIKFIWVGTYWYETTGAFKV